MAVTALLVALLCHLSRYGTGDGATNPLRLSSALKRAGVVDIVGNQAQLFADHTRGVLDQVVDGLVDSGSKDERESRFNVTASGAMFAASGRPPARRLAEEDEVVTPGTYSPELPPLSSNCSGYGFLVNFTEPAYFCNDTRVSQEFYEATVGSNEDGDGTGPFPEGFDGAFANPGAFADAFGGGGGGQSSNTTSNSTSNATASSANSTNSSSNASEPTNLVCEIRQVPVPTCICPLDRTGSACETQRSSFCALDIVPESLQPPSRAEAYEACVQGGPLAAASARDYDPFADGDRPCLVVDRGQEEVVDIPIAVTCTFEDADTLPLLCNTSEITDDLVFANVPNGVALVNETADTCGPGLFFNESQPGAADENATTAERLDAGCQLCPAGTYKLDYGNEESACQLCQPGVTTGSSNDNRTQCLCAEAEGEQFDYAQDACVVRGPYRGLACLERLFEPAYAVVRGVRFAILPNVSLQLRTDPINFHRLYDDSRAALSQPLTSAQLAGATPATAPLPVSSLPEQYFTGGRLYSEIRLELASGAANPGLPAFLSSSNQRVFAEEEGYEEPPVEKLSGGEVAGIVIAAIVGASAITAGVVWLLVIRPRRQAQKWEQERDARLARGEYRSLFDRASELSSPRDRDQ